MGDRISGRESTNAAAGSCALRRRAPTRVAERLHSGRARRRRQSDRLQLQDALRDPRHRRRAARVQRATGPSAPTTRTKQGNHGYRGYSFTSDANLFTPLIAASIPITRPAERRAEPEPVQVRQSFQLQRADDRAAGQRVAPLQPDRALHALERENLGMRAGRTVRLCERRLRSAERVRARATTARRAKTCAIASCWRERLHLPGGFDVTTITQAEARARSRSRRPATAQRIIGEWKPTASTSSAARPTSRRICASPGRSSSASAGRFCRSPSSSISSTATIPAQTT